MNVFESLLKLKVIFISWYFSFCFACFETLLLGVCIYDFICYSHVVYFSSVKCSSLSFMGFFTLNYILAGTYCLMYILILLFSIILCLFPSI